MDWQWIVFLLPWLFVLACPLAMFWMMRGMSRGESCGKKATKNQETAPAAAAPSTDTEIKLLKERLAHLEARNQPTEN